MPLTGDFLSALAAHRVEIVDPTAPLSSTTPVRCLPPPFVSTINFQLEEMGRYDDRGPVCYGNDIYTGKHVDTHVDGPDHWVSGRDGSDAAGLPLGSLIGPAVVLDVSDRVADDPDLLVDAAEIRAWEQEHGPLPEVWLLCRLGSDSRGDDIGAFLDADEKVDENADESGSRTPGFTADCVRWLGEETVIVGLGVETVGTDAGGRGALEPPFRCRHYLLGASELGPTRPRNLAKLPATRAVPVMCPLRIVGGSGSPARVLALVERDG